MTQADISYPNLVIKSFDYNLELKELCFSDSEHFDDGIFEK